MTLAACARPAPVSDPEPAEPQVREDRRDAIIACTEAMRRTRDIEPSARVTDIVNTCKDLWLDPECRAAWSDSLSTPPESRGESVIERCAASICPTLDPQPRLCAQDLATVNLLDEEPDWGTLWKDFNTAVLGRDLGLQASDSRGAIIAMRLLQLVAISGSTPEQGSP